MKRSLGCLLLAATMWAASAQAGMTLADLNPGSTVSGPKFGQSDYKGKVVFVVFWGTH